MGRVSLQPVTVRVSTIITGENGPIQGGQKATGAQRRFAGSRAATPLTLTPGVKITPPLNIPDQGQG
jgi:hypothetical protein